MCQVISTNKGCLLEGRRFSLFECEFAQRAAMPDIVLTTINARYQHSALGLRYLWASLGDLQPRATLCEFTLSDRPIDIVQKIIAVSPRIVGFGVYIWNVEPVTHVVRLLKALRPDIIIIVGGPEVSFELDDPSQIVVQAAD